MVEMTTSDHDGSHMRTATLDPQIRLHEAAQAFADLETQFSTRCIEILGVLEEEARVLTSTFTEAMLRERRARPASERGSIGLRVRRTAGSAPGRFQIEWYRVRGKRRTQYLKRGKDKDGRISHRYRPSAFGRVTDWEKALIADFEPQLSRLRAVQSHIAQIERRFALIGQALSTRDIGTGDTDEPSW